MTHTVTVSKNVADWIHPDILSHLSVRQISFYKALYHLFPTQFQEEFDKAFGTALEKYILAEAHGKIDMSAHLVFVKEPEQGTKAYSITPDVHCPLEFGPGVFVHILEEQLLPRLQRLALEKLAGMFAAVKEGDDWDGVLSLPEEAQMQIEEVQKLWCYSF